MRTPSSGTPPNFARISCEFVPLCTLSLSYSAFIAFRYLIMSQTLSQLVSLQSRPDAAADTVAQYQALPVAHHQMEEATYNSGAQAVEEVVAWTPPPRLFTLICAAPCATLTLGGRPGQRICGGTSAAGFPPFVFCTFSPSPPPWTNC